MFQRITSITLGLVVAAVVGGAGRTASAQTDLSLVCEFSVFSETIFINWMNPVGTDSIEISVDGEVEVTLGASDTSWAVGPLGSGYHELCVRALDSADQTIDQACCDTAFPLPPGSDPEMTELDDTDVAVVWASDPAVDSREICVDDVSIGTIAWWFGYFVTPPLGDGDHEICVKSYDAAGALIDEFCQTVSLGSGGGRTDPTFRRGDCNDDADVNLADAVKILDFLFVLGATPGCMDACDVSDDGSVDVADAVNLLDNLFSGGAPIPAPFPDCGEDPTADGLDCMATATCP